MGDRGPERGRALLLKLLRVPSTGHRHVHSPQEIELLIAESRDGGLLEPEEQVRLHRALRLGLRTASQLMVPRGRLAALDVNTPIAGVLAIVTRSPFSRWPVYRGNLDDVIRDASHKDLVTEYVTGAGGRSPPCCADQPRPSRHARRSPAGLPA